MDEEVEATFADMARRMAGSKTLDVSCCAVDSPQQRPTPVLLTLIAACIAFALAQTLVVPALPALARGVRRVAVGRLAGC